MEVFIAVLVITIVAAILIKIAPGIEESSIDKKQANRRENGSTEVNFQFEISTKKTGAYLFVDIETTGLPDSWNASYTDIDNWPEVVKIAWRLFDRDKRQINSECHISKVDAFRISNAHLHSVTKEISDNKGITKHKLYELLNIDINNSQVLVGHNVDFIKKCIQCEYHRLGKKIPFEKQKIICTMTEGKKMFKHEGFYDYKFPKLEELYGWLFHKTTDLTFQTRHLPEQDCAFVAQCFFKMRQKNYVKRAYFDRLK